MSEKQSTLFCYGGTGSVTGANFVLDTGETRIMVDCGLEQGTPEADAKRTLFRYDPFTIDTLIVTHAHMDHIGRIPLLVQKGFKGQIYSTPATKELAALMFDDALAIMAMEQESSGTVPLYSREDVGRTLLLWQARKYHQIFMLGRDDIGIRFFDAGHVMGSAMVECTRGGRTIVFTGDLGNSPSPLLRDTEALPTAHYLVIESVYGDRLHDGLSERREKFREIVEEVRHLRGVLLIPAFSLERTQVLLYELKQLVEKEGMAPIDVYLDSPLATRISSVYRAHEGEMNERAQKEGEKGDVLTFPGINVIGGGKDSAAIKDTANPKIIIAGSGMSHGGRIQSHEKQFLGEKNTIILFVGYQAVGTLGRRIQEGQKKIRVDDTWVRVRARALTLHGYSAHADRDQLLRVVESGAHSLERVFVAMGEPHSAMFLAQRIHDFLGIDAIAPKESDSFKINW